MRKDQGGKENGIYGVNGGLSPRVTGKVVGAIQSGTPLLGWLEQLQEIQKIVMAKKQR